MPASSHKDNSHSANVKALFIALQPTRVASNTSSLLDHILTNAGWKIWQNGIMHVGLSNHQLIYCTRKILRTKANMHNQIWVLSLKNSTTEFLKEELTKINFPDYNIFSDVDIAYLDLIEKILSVADEIARFRDRRSKSNT